MKTDPRPNGHERFRVSKKNFESKSLNFSKLDELEQWDTTLGDGLDDWDNWYPDNNI